MENLWLLKEKEKRENIAKESHMPHHATQIILLMDGC